ncbi:hypothetical protein [Sphingomonas sp. TREG-RG-20F-R18-01]|uniref:hypothetical protein n=1 Tax=Sphingomonas sp. TREG-RG-20F-R18-01 TaxID=2914982 RepID=UPI001F580207|nr:hypothetical protein [Sphingomonas sp. TREG-RG-20F-R18-01]
MPSERLQGLADTFALFGALPDAAREQIGVEMAMIGRDYLALQQVRVPKETGALESGLSLQLLLDSLRVRVGLTNLTGYRWDLFYGRIVEFGRKAQTVLVQRRKAANGRLRTARGRKRAEDIVASYTLNVKARAAAPFVMIDDADLDRIATQRLADFWSATLTKAGAQA